MNQHEQLKKQIEQQARRMKKAEIEQRSLLAHTVFIGTIGLLFVAPMVAGAFLGAWLDEQREVYSANWTLNLILLGALFGAANVCLFVKRH